VVGEKRFCAAAMRALFIAVADGDFVPGGDGFEGEDVKGESVVVEAPEGIGTACMIDTLDER
jgi:hypothetical protein